MIREKLKSWLDASWHYVVVALLCTIFFLAASSFNFFTQGDDYVKWLSPDESANYVFTKLYGQTGEMQIFERYNLYVDDIMRPRSFRSDYGNIKPVSFLGIILIFGTIVKYSTYKLIPYLTPLIAAVGIYFFYLLIKRLFEREVALLSAFILSAFPVYLYYSARSMFHNVLFTAMLIITLYFSVLMASNNVEKRKFMDKSMDWRGAIFAMSAGIFFGLAIMARTSELLWLGPMMLILWLFNVRQIGIFKLLVFLLFTGMALTPAMYWNQRLYGSPYFGGYPEMNSSLLGIASAGTGIVKSTMVMKTSVAKELLAKLRDYIFFFGFQPKQSVRMFFMYFINMFPWLYWGAAVGFIAYFAHIRKIKKKHIAYLFAYITISLILVFYYGSWGFHDNPNPSSYTIGNSYTRYWLPVYLGAIPFAAYLVVFLTGLVNPRLNIKVMDKGKRLPKRTIVSGLRAVFIILFVFTSMEFVLFGSEEGLIYSAQKQRQQQFELKRILEITEGNSVMITQYHDKLLFPERKVIVGLFDDVSMLSRYARIANYLPVYYYNFTFRQGDIEYLNTRRLKEAGLGIEEVERITKDFTLYRLYQAEGDELPSKTNDL